MGRTRAPLLDRVPGHSGKVYPDWLDHRGQHFRDGMQLGALDRVAGGSVGMLADRGVRAGGAMSGSV